MLGMWACAVDSLCVCVCMCVFVALSIVREVHVCHECAVVLGTISKEEGRATRACA